MAMRAVSSAFLERVVTTHPVATRFTVLTDGEDVQTIDTVTDGAVTLDATAAVRGRCELTVVDAGLVPTTPSDLLAPYGNEIRVERGVYLPGVSAPELVSLGVFGIRRATVTDEADGLAIAVAGMDRSQRLIDARLEEPYEIPAGTNYADAILGLLLAGWPAMPYDFTSTSHTTPALRFEEGDDRWEHAQDMAEAIGMQLYFDGDGTCRLEPAAAIGESAVAATLAEGDGGVLVQAARDWTRESGTYNAVIATGENTGQATPARGVARDDNPASPTYYYGPFGRAPRFYSSPLLTTDGQAEAAAASILARELGTTKSVDFGTFVLPHLEPYDVVTITREQAGIDEDHIIDTLTIPLDPEGDMTGRTRAQEIFG